MLKLPKLLELQNVLYTLTYNDFFSSVKGAIQTWTEKIQNITLAIIVLCVVIVGVMFLFGEGPSRTAKKWLMYIIVGGVLVWGATTLGTTIKAVTNGF